MNTDVTVLLEMDWYQIFPFSPPILLFNFLLIGLALLELGLNQKKRICCTIRLVSCHSMHADSWSVA